MKYDKSGWGDKKQKKKKKKGIRLEYVAQHISHAGSHSNEKLRYIGGHFLFISPSSLGRGGL